jgi:hypothetical protein
VYGVEDISVVPELRADIVVVPNVDPTQPTCVRKLLNAPGLLLGSGVTNVENGITELGVGVPRGKIDTGAGPPNGVALTRLLLKKFSDPA